MGRCAGSTGRRIRDTLLDNVDTSSASMNGSQPEEGGGGRADDREHRTDVQQDTNPTERPEPLDKDDEPPGKTSAVQAGAAWDKAQLNGQGNSSQ